MPACRRQWRRSAARARCSHPKNSLRRPGHHGRAHGGEPGARRLRGAVLRRARQVLEKLGSEIFHVGALGAGHVVKALNNYLGAAGTLAGFEALLVAKAFGLEPQPMLDAINASTGRNWTTERKIPLQILTGAFASGFKLALMTKDVGIAADLAKALGIDAPYLRETLKLWRDAAKKMPPRADHTEIYKYLLKRSTRRKKRKR